MDLSSIITMAAKNPALVQKLASQFGIDPTQAAGAAQGLMGALGGGMQQQVKQNGIGGLANALTKGNHAQYVDNPEKLPEAKEEGNKILSHILGSKEASRDVAGQVAEQTGVDQGILKQMLPMLAMAGMGTLGKATQSQSASGTSGGLESIMGMLDSDGDGNPLNDIMGMLGKKSG